MMRASRQVSYMIFKPSPPLMMVRRLVRSIQKNGLRGAISHSIIRLVRSLKTHGLSGTFSRAFLKAPTVAATEAALPPNPFDLKYGTDTSGYVSGANLTTTSLSGIYSTAYLGIPASTLSQALKLLPTEVDGFRYPDQFTFVDLGSGKGRALLLASMLPFPALVGIDFAPDLCRFAVMNAALFPGVSGRIAVRSQDAITVTYPDGPLLIFMFHPFLLPVLRKVLANLHWQLLQKPRPCMVLYAFDPEENSVLQASEFFEMVWDVPVQLSPEDLAVDRFGETHQRYTLYKANT
jgi:SAM-dependent methyltransferase